MKPNILCGLALILSTGGCAYLGLEEPEIDMSTTNIAMATGGAIGAGLGAIVGSQTGDPGVGLVLGAAAGAGSGALIGNALESQEATLRTQEEAIQRQGQTIATQRQELDALRQIDRDAPLPRRIESSAARGTTSSFASEPRARFQGTSPAIRDLRETTIGRVDTNSNAPFSGDDQLLRNRPLQRQMVDEMRGYESEQRSGQDVRPSSVSPATSSEQHEEEGSGVPRAALRREDPHREIAPQGGFEMGDGSGCQNAAQEVENAGRVQDPSDKLFHFRRALRLCPSRPEFHVGLAETYVTLGRRDDAAYEFREALNLDPNFGPALKGLDAFEQSR